MKSAVAALALGAASAAPSAPSFSEWMIAHSKSYSSAAELRLRRGTYERNVEAILEANERYEDAQQSHWLGVNQFADMSPDEFVAMKTAGRTLPARGAATNAPASDALPASVDWVAKGVVGPVANQGQLGQDWAFSAVEVIESNIAIARGALVALSVQQLVDCADQTNWQQYTQTKGLCTAADYPSSGGQGTCKDTACTPVGKVESWVAVPESETGLMTAVAGQTVFVAVEADQTTFQFYQGGVLTAACGSNVDHAMQLVGYGTDGGNDYWKAKNSWGASWGEKGYIRLGRGKAYGPAGQCGIQSFASYATVSTSA